MFNTATVFSSGTLGGARRLLHHDAALPGDDEIESALVDYHALFGGEQHRVQLRTQREQALRWMRRLAQSGQRRIPRTAIPCEPGQSRSPNMM